MGHEGVLLGAKSDGAVLTPPKPVCKMTLGFTAPGSAEMTVIIDGPVSPAQVLAVIARLARIDRRRYGRKQDQLELTGPSTDATSRLVFTFEAPGSAEFEIVIDGRVTVGQLDIAERWLAWKMEMDYAINLQANIRQQAQNQQLIGQLGRMKVQ